MNGRQMRETERNMRADEFLTARAGDFTGIAVAGAMIAELNTWVAKVQTTYQKQLAEDENVRQDYDEVRDAFQELYDEVREVAGYAVSISRRETGFEELFPSPSGKGRRKLIAQARVSADNGETHLEKFTSRGMEEDFPQSLRQKADALEAALNAASSSTGKRVGATDTLSQDVDAASDIVEEIDPIVRKVYKDDPENLAAWKFAGKVERHTPVPRKQPTS